MAVKKTPVTGKIAKVPVVIQTEMLECGAACLAMILEYYGKIVPLEQVRYDCGVSRDGSSAKKIIDAAVNYGLDAKAYKIEPQILKSEGSFPCIIHWNFNHFVVLKGFRGNKVYINDPASGEIEVSWDVFDESYTGICLCFEPNEKFVQDGQKKSILAFVKERLTKSRNAVIFLTLSLVIASLFEIISPVFSRVLIDRILSGKNPDWTMPLIKCMTGIFCLQVIASALSEIYSRRIEGKINVIGSTSFMWKILSLPLEFFSQRLSGDLMARQESNSSITTDLINTFAPLLIKTAMMIYYLFVMINYSWVLTAIGVCCVVINTFLAQYIAKRRQNNIRCQVINEGKLFSATLSGIKMIDSIKAAGAENGFFEKWAGYQASVNAVFVKFAKLNAYFAVLPSIILSITNYIIIGVGVYLTVAGHFTLGMVTAFQGLFQSFMSPANDLINTTQKILDMKTKIDRVDDVMQCKNDVLHSESDINCQKEFSKLTGNIEINDITFGYSPLDPPLIKDFSLSIKQGQSVAIVGASGSGKSTIAKLIAGLYKPWKGSILFDGKKSEEIDKDVFVGSLAVVDQSITIFDDTIANNIKMWDESIEDFEMILAAKDASMHDVIASKEGAYNHVLIEGGKDLSGGQRQRLEIARVLAVDPTIAILDEATSALDSKTEYEVIKAIKDRGITCIVIAHRLSTVRDCDQIIVLDDGNVVERGTHEELLKADGYYTRLIENE